MPPTPIHCPIDYSTKFLFYAETGFTGKTYVWQVDNLDRTVNLGTVRWYAQWRRYVFAPASGTVFDAECLTDITAFISARTAERKVERARERASAGQG